MQTPEDTNEFPSELPIVESTPTKPKGRRGRPKGSKNKIRKPKVINPVTPDDIINNEGEPKDVEFDLLSNKQEITDTVTANSIKYIFNIISSVTKDELGVWKISDKEAKEIYNAFAAVAEKLPKSTAKKYKKYFDNYTPFIQLAIVLGAVIYPRYELTSKLNQANRTSTIDEAIEAVNRNAAREEDQSSNSSSPFPGNAGSGTTDTGNRFDNDWNAKYGSRKTNGWI